MALFVSSPLASGDRLSQRRDGSHRGITLRKLSGTKQPYEVGPRHVPMPGLRRRDSSFQRNFGRRASETSPCRRTGNAKRRARPPWGDDWQPDRRHGIRDPRALLVWAWCLPRRLQLVFTRSSDRNSLFFVAPIHVGASRTDSFGFDVRFFGHRPGGQSKRDGVRRVPQRDRRGQASEDGLENAVVVSAPVRPCSSPDRAEVTSWFSPVFTSARTS